MKIRKNLANTLIYLSAYIGCAVFALVGGLLFLKCGDEDIKKPLKTALILSIAFIAIEAAVLICEDLFSAIDQWALSYWVSLVADAVKIIVFGFAALSAFSGSSKEFYVLDGFGSEK